MKRIEKYMQAVIKLIGDLEEFESYSGQLFKIKYGESVEFHCEHCGPKRGKSYYFISDNKDKSGSGGVEWCKMCSETFALKKQNV